MISLSTLITVYYLTLTVACYNNYITIYVCDKCVSFNTVESKVLYYFVGWEDLR